MSWIGILVVALGLYLAFKLVGAALRLAMWLLVIAGAYWFLAPYLGWPSLSDLVYVMGPDFDGRRIEEVLAPGQVLENVGGRVVDNVGARLAEGVLERVELPLPEAAPAEPAPGAEPQPEQTGPAPASGAAPGND